MVLVSGAKLAGLILKNYVVEEFDGSPERFDYMVNAQDFGFNHANCIGEVGFKDGELYLCRELYVYEMDTDEIIKEGRRADSARSSGCGATPRSRTVSRCGRKPDTGQGVSIKSRTVSMHRLII